MQAGHHAQDDPLHGQGDPCQPQVGRGEPQEQPARPRHGQQEEELGGWPVFFKIFLQYLYPGIYPQHSEEISSYFLDFGTRTKQSHVAPIVIVTQPVSS